MDGFVIILETYFPSLWQNVEERVNGCEIIASEGGLRRTAKEG